MTDAQKLTTMRAEDLRKCCICEKGVMHTGLPLFYRITIERMGIDVRAVRQAAAMEDYMAGAVAIARVFEDPVIATALHATKIRMVCETCSTDLGMRLPICMLAEDRPEDRPTEQRSEA